MNLAAPLPIKQLTPEEARAIRFVLMDIDDTLTTDGKLSAESYKALWSLHEAGFVVIPITGRPAGWCDCIARQWPVDGIVGENGAFVFWEGEGHRMQMLQHPDAVPNTDARLAALRDRVLSEVPGSRVARDQFSRRFDIAIDFAEEEPSLPLEAARTIKDLFEAGGAHAKISSIHVNAWMGNYDKLSMTIRYLSARFGYEDQNRRSVVFVGDSPNDEPMFAHFPLACGVANILKYQGLVSHWPHFVTSQPSGAGFAEFADILCAQHG